MIFHLAPQISLKSNDLVYDIDKFMEYEKEFKKLCNRSNSSEFVKIYKTMEEEWLQEQSVQADPYDFHDSFTDVEGEISTEAVEEREDCQEDGCGQSSFYKTVLAIRNSLYSFHGIQKSENPPKHTKAWLKNEMLDLLKGLPDNKHKKKINKWSYYPHLKLAELGNDVFREVTGLDTKYNNGEIRGQGTKREIKSGLFQNLKGNIDEDDLKTLIISLKNREICIDEFKESLSKCRIYVETELDTGETSALIESKKRVKMLEAYIKELETKVRYLEARQRRQQVTPQTPRVEDSLARSPSIAVTSPILASCSQMSPIENAQATPPRSGRQNITPLQVTPCGSRTRRIIGQVTPLGSSTPTMAPMQSTPTSSRQSQNFRQASPLVAASIQQESNEEIQVNNMVTEASTSRKRKRNVDKNIARKLTRSYAAGEDVKTSATIHTKMNNECVHEGEWILTIYDELCVGKILKIEGKNTIVHFLTETCLQPTTLSKNDKQKVKQEYIICKVQVESMDNGKYQIVNESWENAQIHGEKFKKKYYC